MNLMPIVLFETKGGDDIVICRDIKGNRHFLNSNTVCLTLWIVIPIQNKYQRVIIASTEAVQTM